MSQNENLIVPQFKVITSLNEARSKLAGCPKFDDMEVVEIRMAANKETVGVFPAHEVWKIVDQADGTREPMTYAMRWPDLYRKFKANEAQDLSGTPLSEAPFLSQSKRMELKALNIHTVEALAAVDGQPLNMLGMGGREMKNQAQVYLDKASDSAVETRLAAENLSLRQQLDDMQAQINAMNKTATTKRSASASDSAVDVVEESADEGEGGIGIGVEPAGGNVSPFDDWEDEDIKLWIAEETGNRPKGNPNHATLVRMADEINEDLAKQAAAQAEGN